jgi:disulfide bond formation protein DsbB
MTMTSTQSALGPNQLGLVAALSSGVLLGGAYYFQYVQGLAPCELCLLQRYPHMVAIVAGLLAFAAFRRRQLAIILLMVAMSALLVTAAIGAYHAGVESGLWPGPQACTGGIPSGLSAEELKKALFAAKMVRCDQVAWSMWGISMAGWNALLSAGLVFLLASGMGKWLKTQP